MCAETVAVLEIEGKQFTLKAGRNYLVGRKTSTGNAAQVEIELQSQTLDAKHALIQVSEVNTKILDLNSKLGTFLNKERLKGLSEFTLATTGTLQLGELIGRIQFSQTLESHDSSGFHDGPKNSSDIICSSPEPTALSGSRLKHMQKNSLTSTPNGFQLQPLNTDHISTQCNFLVPLVPQRKSNASNTSCQSLTKPDSVESSFNNTFGNKSIDSFCIPETQQCAGRVSLGSNSSCELSLADSDGGTDNININSRLIADNEDNDFCIPETQEAPVFPSSQARKRYQAEHAMLEANMPANMFVEEDENAASIENSSQFRICTQDFNEVDCFADDDSNSSNLLADAPCSIVIPRIQHDAVVLNNSGKVLLSDVKEQTSADNLLIEKDMSTLQWSEHETSQRGGSCTPDFLDLPEAAQQIAKNVPVEFPSTSFKAPANPVSDPTLFEDDDLLPTQVFSAKALDAKKTTAGKCSPEYLTLSDKENILPAAAAILEAVDFMDATQVFDAPIVNLECNSRDDQDQLTHPVVTTTTRTTTAQLVANEIAADDDDLLPTQVYPTKNPKATTDIKIPTTSNKLLSSTLQVTSEPGSSDAAALFGEMHQLTPPMVAGGTNFLKPCGALSKKSSTLSNVSITESPDIDLLLCTPQIIAENFIKPDKKAQRNLIDKQKTLFGDDSDEDCDVLELINAPKVSHDFDILLPHLRKPKLSPKREEMEGKLNRYNRSFGEKDKSPKAKSKSDKKISTRSRDKRHLARDKERDKERDKKAESPPKACEKKEEESNKQTRSRKASKTNSEKLLEKMNAKKLDRKRRNSEALETETERKIIKTTKQDKNAHVQSVTETIEVKSAKEEKMAQVKPAAAAKKQSRSETDKFKKDIPSKIKEKSTTVSKLKETTTGRTTRSRSQSHSQSSNSSEQPAELPPRRMTRLKSRFEGEPIPKALTTTRGKKADVVAKKDKQDSDQKELPQKNNKTASSNSSSGSQVNKTNTRTGKNVTCTQERSTSSLVSAHSSSSSTTTTTTPDDAHKLRHVKKLQVSMTMVDPVHFQNLAENAPDIWTVAKDPVESDILIMDKGNRTFKFLIAMAKGIPIVTSSWLEVVNKNRQLTSMTEHFYADESFEKRHKFSLLKSLQMARKQKLFADYHFIMTPGIRPQPDEMEAIIKCAGGTVHVDVPAVKDNQKLYLVTSKDDQKLWHKYRRLNNKISIISSEGVMAAVMRQIVKPLDTNLLA